MPRGREKLLLVPFPEGSGIYLRLTPFYKQRFAVKSLLVLEYFSRVGLLLSVVMIQEIETCCSPSTQPKFCPRES